MELTVGLAFIAGLVSFLSPCVLPLVPAYVGYMGGRMTNAVAASARADGSTTRSGQVRFGTAVHSLFFIAGFTFVFVAIGLLSTAFIQQVGGSNISLVTDVIGRVGGVIIVFFGLHFMGALPRIFAWLRGHERVLSSPLTSLLVALAGSALIAWGFTGSVALWDTPLWDTAAGAPILALSLIGGWLGALLVGRAFTAPGAFWATTLTRIETALYSDTRRQLTASGRQGYAGSAMMGVVFSAGWTPCIGPVYGAVLTLAASGGDVGEAGGLLAAYSLGLGVPFLLTALMLDSAQGVLRRLQSRMRFIEVASGTFLILIGLTVAGGQLQDLSQRLAGDFSEFSVELEESVVAFFTGDDPSETPIVVNESANDAELASLPVGLEVGNRAPDFMTVTDSGDPVALSDLRGQVVLLNFWATWCGPCRVEMPDFQAVYELRAADGFTVLAVNNSEPVDAVRDFRAELGLTFPIAMDEPGRIQNEYGVFSYPSTLLLDRNGVIVARHFGLLTTDQLDQLLAQVLS